MGTLKSGIGQVKCIVEAITEFEKILVTPNSRFDQWLLRLGGALIDVELAGYKLFKSSGCESCHNVAALGGNTFQPRGVVKPCETDNPTGARFAVMGKEADRFSFKVPTLRNVELSSPCFRDGAAATLPLLPPSTDATPRTTAFE